MCVDLRLRGWPAGYKGIELFQRHAFDFAFHFSLAIMNGGTSGEHGAVKCLHVNDADNWHILVSRIRPVAVRWGNPCQRDSHDAGARYVVAVPVAAVPIEPGLFFLIAPGINLALTLSTQ